MTDRREPHGPEADGPFVPELVLERCRLGELPPPEQDALGRRIEADPELGARLAALERSDGEVRRRLHAASLADRVRARLAPSREGGSARAAAWSRVWPLPAGLAVAATVLLALSLRTTGTTPREAPSAVTVSPSAPTRSPGAPTSPAPRAVESAPPASSAMSAATSPTDEPGVRTKGLRPGLSLFRKTANGSETLADGDLAHEGDVIRIGYHPLGRRYGVIVSLDGRGGVTRHLPERGATAAPLEGSDVVLLAHAFRLDDAPAWERFFFVTADAPFTVATVEAAARQVAAHPGSGAESQAPAGLPLPGTLEQSAFLLAKERRP